MKDRQFRAELGKMDRMKWPFQPALAEKAIHEFYDLIGDEWPLHFVWLDSPDQVWEREPKRNRGDNAWTVAEGIEKYNNYRFPADDSWGLCDRDVAENLPRLKGDVPYLVSAEHPYGFDLLTDAYIAGAYVLYESVASKTVYVVSRPFMRVDENGNLHSERKPAYGWFNGPYGYYMRGVEVPEHVVTRSEPLELQDIYECDNMEVRRILTERFGWKKFLKALNAYKVDEDPVHGILWNCDLPPGDPDRSSWGYRKMGMLELKDPSTDRKYFIRVPPERSSAVSARAWTFNKSIKDFKAMVKET